MTAPTAVDDTASHRPVPLRTLLALAGLRRSVSDLGAGPQVMSSAHTAQLDSVLAALRLVPRGTGGSPAEVD
ncbi:hypothetical protein ABZ901_16850 [Actinacidiphila alni]|uniref:hypothetical protein n=1 Tax=Actinacidiphila alni TaxID=380248 RepID=UPI0033C0BCA2